MAIRFSLNGQEVEAEDGETIWQAASRLGEEIPHLCYSPEPGYRADGNCRACMVEIEGERTLAASCIRKPAAGMKVAHIHGPGEEIPLHGFRAAARRPAWHAGTIAHDPEFKFWAWTDKVGLTASRFPSGERPVHDISHKAMRVNLDACINCNLCVRACREVQVNDVIGMAYRGHGSKVVFDFDDPMDSFTCVACGECVQACPTGALMEASLLDDLQIRAVFGSAVSTASAPIAASAARPRSSSRTRRSSRSTAATDRPTRTASASRVASASIMSTIPIA